MGVAEEDVVDFLAPCWQDVVKMVRDASHGGGLGKVLLVKAPRQSCYIRDLIESFTEFASLLVTAPRAAVSFQHIPIHLPVRAVAMKKQ